MGGVRCLGLFPKKKRFFFDVFPYYHCHHSYFHFVVFLKTLHLTSWIINVGFQCFGNILNDDIGNHFERWYLIFENILNVYICLRPPSQPSLSPPSLLCRGANQIIKLTFHCNISFLLFVGYLSILLLVPCTVHITTSFGANTSIFIFLMSILSAF